MLQAKRYTTPARRAAAGRYGAVPYSPAIKDAEALLHDIKQHLPEVIFFRREDLLHTPCFSSVSTITRYAYVCRAVDHLLTTGALVAKSRTDLCLADRQHRYKDADHLGTRYAATIRRVVLTATPEVFTVMDVVRGWKSDQHLTENSKRVAAREALWDLAHEGLLALDGYVYSRTGKT